MITGIHESMGYNVLFSSLLIEQGSIWRFLFVVKLIPHTFCMEMFAHACQKHVCALLCLDSHLLQ